MLADEIQVTLYADIVAAILTVGVLVLCSRGIIRDRFEGKLFRTLLAVVIAMTAFNSALATIQKYSIAGRSVILTLLLTAWELLLITAVCLWLVYVNYRLYHSRDSIRRSFWRYLIPLFAAMILVVGNVFFGYLFYFDTDGKKHFTPGLYLFYLLLVVYLIGFAVFVLRYKKKNRDLLFFDVWSFVTPLTLGAIFSLVTPYSVMPFGLALGLTYVYAGVINEKSFQDRETGYLNRYYMRYLMGQIEKGDFQCKSAMIYRIDNMENTGRFAEMLSPLLPKRCIVIRYSEDTIIMLSDEAERVALHMMEEDVEEGLQKMNAEQDAGEISVRIKSMIMQRKETPSDFYLRFLQEVG